MEINGNKFVIKFIFPKSKFEGIEQSIISKGGCRRQHLHFAYIDTPNFLLKKAGVEFFLRKEGCQWVQTLKIDTDNSIATFEHDVICKVFNGIAPNWDLDLHLQSESGSFFKKRLPKFKVQELQICYQANIWRRKASIKCRNGVIQYVLDKGSISYYLPHRPSKDSIQECKIELIKGDPRNVLAHAKKMIKSYGAFIDTHSNAERIYLLAGGTGFSNPVNSKCMVLKSAGNKYNIITFLINSCMNQVLANQSALNAERQNYSEYLHQLRIGLRRLKVLFKYLAKHNLHVSDKGMATFKSVFSILGRYRNNDYVVNVLNPTLLSLGSFKIELNDITGLLNPAYITRDRDFQLLLIELLSFGFSKTTPIVQSAAGQNNKKCIAIFEKTLIKLLNSRFQFLTNRASQFSKLRDEEIHLMRKKMKFIRYSLEFFKSCCIKKFYPNFYKAIATTLDNFGLFNDICVTIERIEGAAPNDSNLLFAIEWLKLKRKRVRILCEKSLKKMVRISIPWKS
jgi:CHAD domain-containing protein